MARSLFDSMKKSLIGKRIVRYSAVGISLFYVLAGALWILFSGQLVNLIAKDDSQLFFLQSVKGLLYVLVTGVILYFLVRFTQKLHTALLSADKPPKRLYREVFNKSPEAQLIYSPETLEIIDANEQAKQWFGLDLSKQPNVGDMFGINARSQPFLEWLKNTTEQSIPQEQTFDLFKAGGADNQFSVVQHRVFDGEHRVGYMSVRDVSEIRRYIRNIERSTKRLDIAREVSGMGCWEIDLNSQQVFCCNNVNELLELDNDPDEPIPLSGFAEKGGSKILCEVATQLANVEDQHGISLEHPVLDKNDNLKHILVHGQNFSHGDNRSIVGTVVDLTQQKETEQRLIEQQVQWTTLVETLPEGIAIICEEKLMYANQAALKIFNADSVNELIDKPIEFFIQEQDLLIVRERLRNIEHNYEGSDEFVHRHLVRADGEPFEAEIAARRITYQDKTSVQLVIRDLTESQKAQAELASANRRLASLSSKTLDMLERERKRIAGELHDDVGQSLTAIKLATRWLTRRLDDEKLLAKTEDIQQMCANTLETVRNLSLRLRPAQLDSLGLAAAIDWQADKLFVDGHTQFRLDISQFKEIKDKDMEIIAFRVIQESLTNIVRHAEANTIEVKLETEPDEFNFTIVDDGIGFDVNAQSDSTGLVNMKERVELVNGKIRIRSLAGIGTEIKVCLPLKSN